MTWPGLHCGLGPSGGPGQVRSKVRSGAVSARCFEVSADFRQMFRGPCRNASGTSSLCNSMHFKREVCAFREWFGVSGRNASGASFPSQCARGPYCFGSVSAFRAETRAELAFHRNMRAVLIVSGVVSGVFRRPVRRNACVLISPCILCLVSLLFRRVFRPPCQNASVAPNHALCANGAYCFGRPCVGAVRVCFGARRARF